MTTIASIITLSILSYLCGSISSAVIVSKLLNLPDPRTIGSKNPGTTNVLRSGGKKAAIFVLLGDILKGLFPVLVAKLVGITGFGLGLVALAAVLGHIFPIFLKFKGGKGVATTLGVLISLSPTIALLSMITWLVVALAFRYSSLAALVAITLTPIYSLFFHGINYIMPLIAIAVLIIWKHQANIKRLREGTESKIKF
ncbi:MAG: glycerol-3-phosphate 1-O-acyltransferase PlsY [Gammaproteobacteria bacterium]|nr:glycerol-3-phosphate 1-O-acyltransferase PlsY [Gammaproteobacteria bacterium]